jgi:hypothetical protein
MTRKHLPKGLDDRARDQNRPKAGQIRQKRADTQVGTLRKEYGDDIAKSYRSVTYLEPQRHGPEPPSVDQRLAEVAAQPPEIH